MFQFRRFPTYAYLIQRTLTEYCSAGFPHSVILGSKLMCSSPRLIAACHDLLRLLMPRHSPCALISLTFVGAKSAPSVSPTGLRPSGKCFVRFLAPPLLAKPAFAGLWLGFSSIWFSSSLRIMQASVWLHCSFCYPNSYIKVHKSLTLLPLCCLLAISCLLHCSVFKVQLSVLFQGQIETLNPLNASI